jgi:hypothetical protein
MPNAVDRNVGSINTIYISIVAVLGSLLALSNFLEEKLSLFSILRYQHTVIGSTYKIVSIATIIFAAMFYVFIVKRRIANEAKILQRIVFSMVPIFFICLFYLLYIDNGYIITYEFNGIVKDIFRPFNLNYPDFASVPSSLQNKEIAVQLRAGLGPAEMLDAQLRSDGWLVYSSYLTGAALMAMSLNVALIVLAYLAAVGTDALTDKPGAVATIEPEPVAV